MAYRRYDFSGVHENQITRLTPHPLNEKIYGAQEPDAAFLKSIADNGVINPIVVNKKKQILSGTRRWMAARTAGFSNIPVIGFLYEDDVLCQLFLIEANRFREKTTEMRAREFIELKRIEAALAKERQGTRTDIGANLPLSSTGKARDIAAEKVGLGGRTAEKLADIIHKTDAGDAAARKILDSINRDGRGVDSAHKKLFSTTDAEGLKQKRLTEKTSARSKADELRALFSTRIELQASKEPGLFNLFFHKKTEEEIRQIAEALRNA